MKLLILCIILFIIFNLKNKESFSSSTSPIISSVLKKRDYIDISFTKQGGNRRPGDTLFYELYFKKEDSLLEVEKTYSRTGGFSVNEDNIIYDTWEKRDIECDNIECNHILELDNNFNYYFFILTNLNGRRSTIRDIHKVIYQNNPNVYSPDILQLKK